MSFSCFYCPRWSNKDGGDKSFKDQLGIRKFVRCLKEGMTSTQKAGYRLRGDRIRKRDNFRCDEGKVKAYLKFSG